MLMLMIVNNDNAIKLINTNGTMSCLPSSRPSWTSPTAAQAAVKDAPICIYVYIYIYIEREKEIERDI